MIAGSKRCNKGELDIYSVPPTLSTMNRAFINDYQPVVNPDGNTAPIEFIIPPQMERWTDLLDIELHLMVKLVKSTGANTDADGNITTICNVLHSLFSHVDVFISGKLISGNDKYPYRAFIETLCGASKSDQDMLEDTQMWGKAQTGEIRGFKTYATADDSSGAYRREVIFGGGRVVELHGHIHTDITRQTKYLPTMCPLTFRFVRSKPDFYLMGDGSAGAEILIQKAILKIRTVALDPSVGATLTNALRMDPMKLPITRVEVTSFTVMDGLESKIESNLIHGQIPRRIIIGQVKNKNMNGHPDESPFRFEHFDITKLKVTVDGVSIEANPLRMDFTTARAHQTLHSYRSFWKALGAEHGKDLAVFPLSVYESNHVLWAFDFTPDLGCEEGHIHPIRNGNIEFDMEWKRALVDPINVMVYAEYDDLIIIDGKRQVTSS